jgi:hypothetical protein
MIAPRRCFQIDTNWSQFDRKPENLFGTDLTPLVESGGAVLLEILSGVEMVFLIELRFVAAIRFDAQLPLSPSFYARRLETARPRRISYDGKAG